jgi:hypothetical protein
MGGGDYDSRNFEEIKLKMASSNNSFYPGFIPYKMY